MSMPQSLILVNNPKLDKSHARLKNFLTEASKLNFWRTHFKNKRFRLNLKKFSWDYWQTIPFVTKKDFEKLGIKKRLLDAKIIITYKPGRFILQPTSGTSKQTGPLLFLKNVDCLVDGTSHNKGNRTLILYQGRSISLRDVIALLHESPRQKRIVESLSINPFQFDGRMISAVKDFNPDAIVTFPSSIGYLNSYHPKSPQMLSRVEHVWLSGDFFSLKQKTFTNSILKKAMIDIDYITTEVDTIGICCKYLRSQYGMNAYHPFKERLVELIDIDESGYGEVVVTKISPLELSYIRYKTGDIAKAVNKSCKCGNKWTIFLMGRKNMDHIKSLGVLITRAEIERVLKSFEDQIEEWSGEVREVQYRGAFIGELTLIIKTKSNLSVNNNSLAELKENISRRLFLTPKNTLAMLAKENKFKPLKIRIVDDFPPSSKKVLLKKVVN